MSRIQRASEHLAMPWANGTGVTYQVATSPEGADLATFDWRISMAEVGEDGPFSLFAGIDRVLTVLGPGDMRLFINGHEVLSRKFSPVSFSGDDDVLAELVDGPIVDLNVMTRRGRYTSAVDVQHIQGPVQFAFDSTSLPLAVILDGQATTSDGDVLTSRDVVFVDDSISLDGDATIAIVTLHEAFGDDR